METLPVTEEPMPDSDVIAAKLQSLEDKITYLSEIKALEHAENRSRLQEMQELLTRHDHILLGNAKLGLLTQVDRLLQKEESRTWMFRAIAMSTIGLLAKAVFDVFTGRP